MLSIINFLKSLFMKNSVCVCVIFFLLTVSCNNNSVIGNISDKNYFSISNEKVEDLKYLIGIKVRQLSEDKKIEEDFEVKRNKIELKYNDEILKYIESEGFLESDFLSDTSFVNGEPMDDYHIKKQKVSTKKNELEVQKEEEISKLRFSMLTELIAKDELLKTLVEEYKDIVKKRSDILLNFGIQQSDSANFFRKKIKSDIKDDLWDEIIKD